MKNIFNTNGLVPIFLILTVGIVNMTCIQRNNTNSTEVKKTNRSKLVKKVKTENNTLKAKGNDTERDQSEGMLKDYEKRNKHLKKQLREKVENMEDAQKEVKKLKHELKKRKQNDGLEEEIKNIMVGLTKYHSFYKQLEFQMKRQNNLRNEVESRVKTIENSEKKVDKIYAEVKADYKGNLDSLMKKITFLQGSNRNLHDRLFTLEKDAQGDKLEGASISKKEGVDSCVDRLSCGICIENPGCVWCSVQRRCTRGGGDGPADLSCTSYFKHDSCT